ncbi:MAG TPA: hypothetical protein PLT65_00780 [Bacilli bacterium]|nr:hypothetical protein [Bacilli bacterium]
MRQIINHKMCFKSINDILVFLNINESKFLEIDLHLLNVTTTLDKSFQDTKTLYFETYNELESIMKCILEEIKKVGKDLKIINDRKAVETIELSGANNSNIDNYLRVYQLERIRIDILNRKIYLLFPDNRYLLIYSNNWIIASEMNNFINILIYKHKLKLIGSLQ